MWARLFNIMTYKTPRLSTYCNACSSASIKTIGSNLSKLDTNLHCPLTYYNSMVPLLLATNDKNTTTRLTILKFLGMDIRSGKNVVGSIDNKSLIEEMQKQQKYLDRETLHP